MRDFTLTTYRTLLDSLQATGKEFQTFETFIRQPAPQAIVLRHDVDYRRYNALDFAKIQFERGIRGTYFFRVIPEIYDEDLIREIHEMGHEIGYHYEDMDFARGNPQKAIKFFEEHLQKLRNIVPVTTICMHGSPRSKYDNKDVWNKYNYRDYDIIGEPYFDVDFSKVFYLTDTGRRWDGRKVSVRDKVPEHFDLSFHSTHEISDFLKTNRFPNQVMFNFHPHRWSDDHFVWLKEKHFQAFKNWIKYWMLKLR